MESKIADIKDIEDTTPKALGLYTKEDLKDILRNQDDITLTFTKINGDERVMRCTLKEDKLPERVTNLGAQAENRPENNEVIAVWDLDVQGWRSFRLENIKKIEGIQLAQETEA